MDQWTSQSRGLPRLPQEVFDQTHSMAAYRGLTFDAYVLQALHAYNRDTQREKDLMDSLSDIDDDTIQHGKTAT